MLTIWTLKFLDPELDHEFNKWLLRNNEYLYSLFLRVAMICNCVMMVLKCYDAATNEQETGITQNTSIIIGMIGLQILLLFAGIWINKKHQTQMFHLVCLWYLFQTVTEFLMHF